MKQDIEISVLMSVFNGERYLSQAIESILNQTFTDFEFLIINDGSTDKSRDIVLSFHDPRIRLIDNPSNFGLAKSLNIGIDLAKGKYIARMDADDISVPERLEKQINFIRLNSCYSLVFTNVELINNQGEFIGYWDDDISADSSDLILKLLPEKNCVAHPTLLIKRDILARFKYLTFQKNSQDWNLWLRLASRNFKFAKINEKLLKYRIHENSLTVIANKKNLILKIIKIQLYFILYELFKLRLNKFNLLVIKYLIKNSDKLFFNSLLAVGLGSISKNRAKIRNLFHRLKTRLRFNGFIKNRRIGEINILYIIPHMVVGGADKVNIDIISNLDNELFSINIITTNNNNHVWNDRFEPFADNIWHLSTLLDEKDYTRFILYLIKQLKINLIFISNSAQGYISLPVIKKSNKNIKVVDLLHGEGGKLEDGGFPFFSCKYDQYIDLRIVINDYLQNHLITKFNINPQKILIIKNGLDANYYDADKVYDNSFRDIYQIDDADIVITFVGRLDYEKHPENVILLANNILNSGYKNYKFLVAGNGTEYATIDSLIKENQLEEYVYMLGYVENIRQLLKDSDILFLCSEMEGLPLIILEAMAMKLPVITSNVGGIPEIIENHKNGFIVDYDHNFIKNCSDKILHLSKEEMKIMGENNRKKIIEMCSLQKMVNDYSNVFYKLINDH